MAFSSKNKSRTIAGSKIMEVWSWDAAAVTLGSISTGLSVVEHVSINNTVTAGAGKAVPSGGKVDISGLTLNDVGTVLVVGY